MSANAISVHMYRDYTDKGNISNGLSYSYSYSFAKSIH